MQGVCGVSHAGRVWCEGVCGVSHAGCVWCEGVCAIITLWPSLRYNSTGSAGCIALYNSSVQSFMFIINFDDYNS